METLDLARGPWWRFDKYEIGDGYVRPAAGAQLSAYDPWDVDLQKGDAPYRRFVEFVDAIETGPPSEDDRAPFGITDGSARLIVDWCAEFGLLGSLPQRALIMELAPSWEPLRGQSAPRDTLAQTAVRHVRDSYGWQSIETQQLSGTWLVDEPEMAGELVSDQDRAEQFGPGSVTLFQQLRQDSLAKKGLGEVVWQYFPGLSPDVGDTFQYPRPESDDFWHIYAEPIHRFVSDSWAARNAIMFIKAAVEGQEVDRVPGGQALGALLSGVSPALGTMRSTRDVMMFWRAPSLMAALVMMAVQDLVMGKKRLYQCANCGRPAVSAKTSAQYCSPRCRQTAQKRAQRARGQERTG